MQYNKLLFVAQVVHGEGKAMVYIFVAVSFVVSGYSAQDSKDQSASVPLVVDQGSLAETLAYLARKDGKASPIMLEVHLPEESLTGWEVRQYVRASRLPIEQLLSKGVRQVRKQWLVECLQPLAFGNLKVLYVPCERDSVTGEVYFPESVNIPIDPQRMLENIAEIDHKLPMGCPAFVRPPIEMTLGEAERNQVLSELRSDKDFLGLSKVVSFPAESEPLMTKEQTGDWAVLSRDNNRVTAVCRNEEVRASLAKALGGNDRLTSATLDVNIKWKRVRVMYGTSALERMVQDIPSSARVISVQRNELILEVNESDAARLKRLDGVIVMEPKKS